MSNEKKKKSFMSRVRNFFILVIVAIVIFLASLFGNIFPGLNDFRDGVLEKVGYYEIVETSNDAVEVIADSTANIEIKIENDSIYYMGNEVSVQELSDILEANKYEYATMIDNGATQRTWSDVYDMLLSKNIALKEEFMK